MEGSSESFSEESLKRLAIGSGLPELSGKDLLLLGSMVSTELARSIKKRKTVKKPTLTLTSFPKVQNPEFLETVKWGDVLTGNPIFLDRPEFRQLAIGMGVSLSDEGLTRCQRYVEKEVASFLRKRYKRIPHAKSLAGLVKTKGAERAITLASIMKRGRPQFGVAFPVAAKKVVKKAAAKKVVKKATKSPTKATTKKVVKKAAKSPAKATTKKKVATKATTKTSKSPATKAPAKKKVAKKAVSRKSTGGSPIEKLLSGSPRKAPAKRARVAIVKGRGVRPPSRRSPARSPPRSSRSRYALGTEETGVLGLFDSPRKESPRRSPPRGSPRRSPPRGSPRRSPPRGSPRGDAGDYFGEFEFESPRKPAPLEYPEYPFMPESPKKVPHRKPLRTIVRSPAKSPARSPAKSPPRSPPRSPRAQTYAEYPEAKPSPEFEKWPKPTTSWNPLSWF
jgi:hypothetical protein